jgi:hypothetical protein
VPHSIIIDGDDEAEAKEKALAEHVARHPEDVGRTVEDFKWILRRIVRPAAYGRLAVRKSRKMESEHGSFAKAEPLLWNVRRHSPSSE